MAKMSINILVGFSFLTLIFGSSNSFAHLVPAHVVAEEGLKATTCNYEIQEGDWLLKVLRNFGYTDPFVYTLTDLVKEMNGGIQDINELEKGEFVQIPIVLQTKDSIATEKILACNQLLRVESPHFGVNTYVQKDRGDYFLYSYRPHEERASSERLEREISSVDMKEAFTPGSMYSVSLGGVFDTLEGTKNSSTIFVSELQPALDLKWIQLWAPGWKSFIQAQIIFKSYTNFRDDVTTAENLKLNQGNLFLGIEYSLLNSLTLKSTLGFGESVYYSKDENDIYSIQKAQAFKPQLELKQRFMEKGPLFLSGFLQGQSVISSDAVYEGGYELGLGVELGHNRKESKLKGRIQYSEGFFETDLFSFKQRILMFNMIYEAGL